MKKCYWTKSLQFYINDIDSLSNYIVSNCKKGSPMPCISDVMVERMIKKGKGLGRARAKLGNMFT